MTTEKILRSLSQSGSLEKAFVLVYAKEEYRLGADCLSHIPLEEKILLKAYEHFTNIYIALHPYEDSDDIKGVIAQALDRKAFTCLKLATLNKAVLYNLLANDFFNLALTYSSRVKAFNVVRANIYLGLSLHALSCNDLSAAESNLTAGFSELNSHDDLAAREIKGKLNQCLQKYKIALGIEPVKYEAKTNEFTECQVSGYVINARGF